MNKGKFTLIPVCCFLLACILYGCTMAALPEAVPVVEKPQKYEDEEQIQVETVKKKTLSEGNLTENKSLYKNEDDYSVITMYLTVSRGNEADGSDHTWKEINTYSVYDYRDMGVDRFKVEGILQIDETGNGIDSSSFGYDETVPNVSVQIRGQTSSKSAQKNFKVRIKEGKGDFRGQRTLDLNKHVGEPYRFINKLCYDLLEPIPQLIGGRTQFVHLYVKDRTGDDNDAEYLDYGLYTMVEQVNRAFLKSRGLDENGQLYKVSFFEWNKLDEIMTPKDDPEFDMDQFEQYLESKGHPDPTKLQRTIDEIHDYSKPIEQIVDEHFDAENICYWMAFNILNGNMDVGSRNLYIYSPLNSEKFYLMCWDMDASFREQYMIFRERHDGESWEQGMTKFLGLTLINRMMKQQKYRDMLTDAVEDLYRNYISSDIVNERAEKYARVVKPFAFSEPDFEHVRIRTEADYDRLVSTLGAEVENNYIIFKDTMNRPWPFFVDVPTVDYNKDETLLNWGISFDYYSESVTYDYTLAADYFFNNVIDEGHELSIPVATTQALDPGTYYLKVTATNESGYSSDCFDYYSVSGYGKCYGCYCFTVNDDGTVKAFEKELK